ncbi:hypothetical protein H4R33_003072 [Dimargaris cristalligena]|nr:hypothetical protein H4R33_003072 [Dimargaris cristalligena]
MDQFFIQPVERKIASLCWWSQSSYSPDDLFFLTGTWDRGSHNELALWKCPGPNVRTRQFEPNFKAHAVATIPHAGEVADVVQAQDDMCVTASSDGCLYVYKLTQDSASLKIPTALQPVRTLAAPTTTFRSPRTALSVQPHKHRDPEVASVGEDGLLQLFLLDRGAPVDSIVADCLPLYDVAWLSSSTLLTTSRGGQLKVFDRRTPSKSAAVVFIDPISPDAAVNCVAVHPSQTSRLATGNELGQVTTWDIRQYTEPQSQTLAVHNAEINDLVFHPNRPFTIVTASEDSTCGVVDASAFTNYSRGPGAYSHDPFASSAPSSSFQVYNAPRKSNIYNRLPINCLDLHPQNGLLLAGSDSENLLFDIN